MYSPKPFAAPSYVNVGALTVISSQIVPYTPVYTTVPPADPYVTPFYNDDDDIEDDIEYDIEDDLESDVPSDLGSFSLFREEDVLELDIQSRLISSF